MLDQSGPLNSLGFAKSPAKTRVVVAMSGGVDSSVVAAELKTHGYDVVGVTLQLYDHGDAVPTGRTCCAGQDIYDARTVADRIGFPHYVLDYESKFRQSVMDEFADSYLQGETPIPCVRCNERVKFRDLLGTAKDLGAAALATGHYVQRQDGPAGPELLCGADPDKDQSYFLFSTNRQQLEDLRGYGVIQGNVFINPLAMADLEPLSSLERIEGTLDIAYDRLQVQSLKSLYGLQALRAISGYVQIENCNLLEHLGGLEALRVVGDS